jgi:hypothetical protein
MTFKSITAMGFMGIRPGLGTIPDLRECAVPSPIQSPSGGRDIVAPHRCRNRLDHETDRIYEHMGTVELPWDLIGAIGVGPWCDLCRLTPSHIHRRSVAPDLVSSPKHLHKAVQVFCPRNAL